MFAEQLLNESEIKASAPPLFLFTDYCFRFMSFFKIKHVQVMCPINRIAAHIHVFSVTVCWSDSSISARYFGVAVLNVNSGEDLWLILFGELSLISRVRLFENRFLFDKNILNTTSSLHFFSYRRDFILSFPPLKTSQIFHLTVIWVQTQHGRNVSRRRGRGNRSHVKKESLSCSDALLFLSCFSVCFSQCSHYCLGDLMCAIRQNESISTAYLVMMQGFSCQ